MNSVTQTKGSTKLKAWQALIELLYCATEEEWATTLAIIRQAARQATTPAK